MNNKKERLCNSKGLCSLFFMFKKIGKISQKLFCYYDKGYILGWQGRNVTHDDERRIFGNTHNSELYDKFQAGYEAGRREYERNPSKAKGITDYRNR